MKKLLTIMLASALVLALTAPAMAMHFEMNGQLRVRSWYLDNYWPRVSDGMQSGDMEFVDQRFRTTMTWGITESVFLKARADINEGFWGSGLGQVTETAEVNPVTGISTQGLSFTNVQTKQPIAFDQMYMQFVWPGAPLTFTVGRQPVNWGTGMAAKSDNRDRLKIAYKFGDWTALVAYDKNVESFLQELEGAGSDSRNYVAAVVGNVSGWKTGLLYLLQRNEANTPGFVAEGFLPTPLDGTTNLFDVFLIGAAGPVSLKFDIAFTTGEAGLKGAPLTDTEGLGAYAGAFFNAGMTNIGLEYAYARGDDPNSAENEGAFSHDYHGPMKSIILWNGMDYQGVVNLNAGVGGDIGVRNAHAVKGSITASPTEKLTLIGALVWGKRDEVQEVGRDDDFGVEADGILVYNIYDNVAYTLGLGYLWAGDWFGSEQDDILGMMNGIEVKF